MVCILVCLLGGIYYFEHTYEQQEIKKDASFTPFFSNVGDLAWRGIITSTTIGYGDKFPRTDGGRVLAFFYIVVTIGLFSEIISKVNQSFLLTNYKKMHGLRQTSFTGHLIMYGTKLDETKEMIQQLDAEFQGDKDFVFIGDFTETPTEIVALQEKGVSIEFVAGKPDVENVISLAGVAQAREVVLLSENTDSDKHMISYIMSVRMRNPQIPIVAEIIDSDNYKEMFLQAGATKVVDTGSIGKNIMTRTLTDKVDVLLEDILGSGEGYELYRVPLTAEWIGKTFAEVKTKYAASAM